MKLRYKSRCASVLVVMLVITTMVSVLVAALLMVAQEQNYSTARSATWGSEIPMAEAGIEEAMAHLNSGVRTFITNGWQLSGSNVIKSRYFTNDGGNYASGYFYTAITTSKPPVIVSIGYGRIPRNTNYTSRTVVALTKRRPPGWGIVGKTSVSMNGNPYIDSYDSNDSNYSTGGRYDPAKRDDRAGVATPSTNLNAINTGGGQIYGTAATGPGGTVSGNVGDGPWLTSNSGQQTDHVRNDFNMAITNVAVPSPWAPQTVPLVNQLIGGVIYGNVLTAGDWQFGSVNVNSSSGSIYVQGKVRVYFTGDFSMSSGASVTLAPGATLEMYMGASMDLAGNCVINPTGIPANCRIYGLPTCTSMKYAGNAAAYCMLYAPNADITVTGNFDFNGSVLGNNVRFSGTADIHYDEALAAYGPEWGIVSWEELR